MRNKKGAIVGIVVALVALILVFCLLRIFVFKGGSKKNVVHSESVSEEVDEEVSEAATPTVVPETNDVISAVSSYSYIERHTDGSFVNYVIYPVDGEFVVLTKYQGVGGGYYYHTAPLNSSATARFKDAVNDFTLVQEQSSGSGAYTKGVLTLTTSSGQSIYNIAPIDISGYGLVNPWEDDIKEVVVEPDCVSLFNTHQIGAVAGIVDDVELSAYIQMIYDQMKTFISDDITSVEVNFDVDEEDSYQLTVHRDGQDAIPVNVYRYGYVKGSVWDTEPSEAEETEGTETVVETEDLQE